MYKVSENEEIKAANEGKQTGRYTCTTNMGDNKFEFRVPV